MLQLHSLAQWLGLLNRDVGAAGQLLFACDALVIIRTLNEVARQTEWLISFDNTLARREYYVPM